MIRGLSQQGMITSQISRETGYNRRTIRKYITTQQPPVGQKRSNSSSKLDKYRDYINERIRDYPLVLNYPLEVAKCLFGHVLPGECFNPLHVSLPELPPLRQ